MTIAFNGNTLIIDGKRIVMPWPVLEAVEEADRVFVLMDPDSYLRDPAYKKKRRQGAPAVKNLIAFDKEGLTLWEADLPTPSDYYYHISSYNPLIVNSFSSYRCEIDSSVGTIRKMDFVK